MTTGFGGPAYPSEMIFGGIRNAIRGAFGRADRAAAIPRPFPFSFLHQRQRAHEYGFSGWTSETSMAVDWLVLAPSASEADLVTHLPRPS